MGLVFRVVVLLVALAIVALAAKHQLQASRQVAVSPRVTATSAATGTEPSPRQVQQKVLDDVTRALQQGAAQRQDESQ